MRKLLAIAFQIGTCLLLAATPVWSQTEPPSDPDADAESPAQLDISPDIIENSPVLQRWREEVPNVWREIRNDPSFRTRVRLGYSQFMSDEEERGVLIGVEDIFLGRTGLTVSGSFQTSFDGDFMTYGGNLNYYILPLGGYINIAPLVGYRHLEIDDYSTSGVQVGAKLLLALSRGGAADIALSQSFVSPGSSDEVGLTALSIGYAITPDLRLSTDIERQNSKERKDYRLGIVLEWMP